MDLSGLSDKQRRTTWIRRTSRNTIGKPPRVRVARSIVLDANRYSVTVDEASGAQSLEVMTMEKG